MAETKVIRRRTLFLAAVVLCLMAVSAWLLWGGRAHTDIRWQRVPMDGHRTGVVSVNAENVDTALGRFDDDGYIAPGGARYPDDSPVARVALALMDVQPGMAHLKQVVGHSARTMPNLRTEPETELSNLFVDALRDAGSAYFGVPMDFALTNFGGIRCPLPEGPVTLDDIASMFPFRNYMVYARMKGSALLRLFDQLAGTQAFQAVSGARIVVRNHQLVSAEIGGAPVDPDREYHVTTIDFLLDGGDRIAIGALADDVVLSHVLLKDVMLDYVRAREAAGEVLDAHKDGRVVMLEQ